MKILITGFKPFNNETINPSLLLLSELDKNYNKSIQRDWQPLETNRQKSIVASQSVLDMIGFILGMKKMTINYPYIIQGVTGFVGSSGKGAKPTPLQPYEVDNILNNMGISRFDVDNELEVGAKVKIIAGPFTGMY